MIIGELGAPVSHAPLRCPNLLFTFKGRGANDVATKIYAIAKRQPMGRATFQVSVLGQAGFDDHFKVPVFIIESVQSFSYLN
jgi:hypothetical protein